MKHGMTGAPEQAASKAAPIFASCRSPSPLLPPSGKTPTKSPALKRDKACRMARGSDSPALTGIVCIPK